MTKNVKVIFDTNVWISFLIGKHLTKVKQHLVASKDYNHNYRPTFDGIENGYFKRKTQKALPKK